MPIEEQSAAALPWDGKPCTEYAHSKGYDNLKQMSGHMAVTGKYYADLRAFSRIAAMGVELEGGWNREIPGASECECECELDTCYDHRCQHEHDRDCLDDGCCDHVNCCDDCQHAHRNRCYGNCQHECDIEECYEHNCRGGNTGGQYYHSDGSVSVSARISGEMVSPACGSLTSMEAWVNDYYPDKTNRSCGTHFHVSVVDDANYNRLMDPRFYAWLMSRVEAWKQVHVRRADNNLHSRIAGENDFCCRNDATSCVHGRYAHTPDQQLAGTRSNKYISARYAQINYCYNVHGTMEVRVFHGMSTPAVIMSAASVVAEAVETWLEYCHQHEALQVREGELVAA